MGLIVECMCLECGISHHLDRDSLVLDDRGGGVSVVTNLYCQECDGLLRLIGKAGDEPCYRLD